MHGLDGAQSWPNHARWRSPGLCTSSPQVLHCHGSGGRRTGVAEFPLLTVPTCLQGVGGEQRGAGVFVGYGRG
jgi:hypothetical protein